MSDLDNYNCNLALGLVLIEEVVEVVEVVEEEEEEEEVQEEEEEQDALADLESASDNYNLMLLSEHHSIQKSSNLDLLLMLVPH